MKFSSKALSLLSLALLSNAQAGSLRGDRFLQATGPMMQSSGVRVGSPAVTVTQTTPSTSTTATTTTTTGSNTISGPATVTVNGASNRPAIGAGVVLGAVAVPTDSSSSDSIDGTPAVFEANVASPPGTMVNGARLVGAPTVTVTQSGGGTSTATTTGTTATTTGTTATISSGVSVGRPVVAVNRGNGSGGLR